MLARRFNLSFPSQMSDGVTFRRKKMRKSEYLTGTTFANVIVAFPDADSMASLRVKLPNQKGEMTHVLAGARITIGRRPDNTIQIVDKSVSGHHAELIAVKGHYRLHDLGSTNLTCVDGQPITDYHLHRPCQVAFGTVECEFNPDASKNVEEDKPAELVPTRAELDFLRRENLELEGKISALENQIEILSSARLTTKESSGPGLTAEANRRLAAQCEELRVKNEHLEREIANLKDDLLAVTRDRDATRQAWETVKVELQAARQERRKT